MNFRKFQNLRKLENFYGTFSLELVVLNTYLFEQIKRNNKKYKAGFHGQTYSYLNERLDSNHWTWH